jgi:muramidase (phage lysozyme)
LKKDGEYFTVGKKCECEAKIRAFMRVIRIAEGTGEYVKGTKTARDPQLGYTTWFSGSGNNFTLGDDHPRVINSNSTNTLRSSAAGAYQIMSWKFDELNGYKIVFEDGYYQKKDPQEYTEKYDKAKKYDAKGFSQVSQDKLCIIILKDIGAVTKLLNKDIKGAISTSSGTWVSLPGATAGQPTAKMQETLDYYDEFLKEELSGKSHLHIKSGFLKEFGITCNCGNESSSEWHHPLDRMELRGWYGAGFFPGDSDHGNAPDARKKDHDGLDLYAPIGTTLYACIDGEVYEDYISDTYGNTLGIKGTYNGTTYYFFYAHLSERSVVKGATVSSGDIIGKSGQSGNASGQAAKMNHLHFEVRNTSERTGGKLNPFTTIDELNRDVITNPDQNTQTGN